MHFVNLASVSEDENTIWKATKMFKRSHMSITTFRRHQSPAFERKTSPLYIPSEASFDLYCPMLRVRCKNPRDVPVHPTEQGPQGHGGRSVVRPEPANL